ncbi:hypothetical protein [Microbacterium sp. A84]|uniref:CdiA C-terminal domain-containing protein n=1 Tax=Microbacterium sp. A84 TaxID=3450715 RepID=UPI003F41F82C
MKNLDILMNGQTWEIKTPRGSGRRTISNQFCRAKEQGAERLVLDTSRTELGDAVIYSEALRRFEHSTWLTSLILTLKSGAVVFVEKA